MLTGEERGVAGWVWGWPKGLTVSRGGRGAEITRQPL